jgi:hypothetical protein
MEKLGYRLAVFQHVSRWQTEKMKHGEKINDG